MTATKPEAAPKVSNTATGVIDGRRITVPKGTMIIRAAELLGIEIPRFCDHPRLAPVAACRMCLVEIEGMGKPQPSCAIPLGDDMVVKTQFASAEADTAQRGVMEFLLLNHPLDCPVCDKGGECPLQNQAMSAGNAESRFHLAKRKFPKPVNVNSEILLDRERCVSCARCTRFAAQIAGDPFISLQQRGASQQVGIGEEPFDSYFSGNTVQICPVGALTSVGYRFRARPFDLVSVPTVCEHCACGCALRTDYRHEAVMRRLAWEDSDVNEDWNCDKGRYAFTYADEGRLTTPLVREGGELRPASWPEAISHAAAGLSGARGRAGFVVGGRLTVEDAYAYSRFARSAMGTDSVDFRARAASWEEADFLAFRVAGTFGPTYQNLDSAPAVLLVGFEPEEESPIVFLRLRKAVRNGGTEVISVAPFMSEGVRKCGGRLHAAVPGAEAETLAGLPAADIELLKKPGALIMVGERLVESAGAFSAAAALADKTGAVLAWMPRRAGERGALEAGCLPGLLPGGRPLTDVVARAEVAASWGTEPTRLPTEAGLDLEGMIAAVDEHVARDGGTGSGGETVPSLGALVVAGVEVADLADPDGFMRAVEAVPFVVSLETRPTEVTGLADVVFPVAVVTEKAGGFVNWEGRQRDFPAVFNRPGSYSDAEVLAMLSERMGLDVPPRTVAELNAELGSLGRWTGARTAPPPGAGGPDADVGPGALPGPGEAVLATWRLLLDLGVMQEGEPFLAGTRKPTVARLSAATAAGVGVADGDPVSVSSGSGSITVPAKLTEMPDGIVWIPANSPDSRTATLRARQGDTVRLARGGIDA
ncbi:MAG: NADH-quinone oxidoreductase subunit G [Candidatus Nanopelagicales bacterium]|nr:NADH-quinone oxidoreductase subunit G [Candidatus Nanopelagicales bacterium]